MVSVLHARISLRKNETRKVEEIMKKQITRYFPLIAVKIFLLTAAGMTISALLSDLKGDNICQAFLSGVIGLSYGRAVLYFAVTAVMTALLGICLFKTEMHKVKKFLYVLILFCFFVMGFCPLNIVSSVHPSIVFGIHIGAELSYFGLAAVISLLSAIFAKTKAQRIIGLLPVCYAVILLLMPESLRECAGIWEILFIMQPMLALQAEQYSNGGMNI